MTVEDLAKELCYKFYFGWMNGYNDLARSKGFDEVSADAVKAKADESIDEFMDEANEMYDKLSAG